MAKGKDFRGGLNSLLKKTEPVKKKKPVVKTTKPIEVKAAPKKPQEVIPIIPKNVVTKKPVKPILPIVPPVKIEVVKKELALNLEEKLVEVQPKTNYRVISKTSKRGTKEGETRATFIVKEDFLEKFKALAYLNRKSLKKIMASAMQQYLDIQGDEMVEKALKSFREKD